MVDHSQFPSRSAGYCEQLDVHEPLTTVREALEFSALLRQAQDVPKEEKLQYVDVVIDLLELHDLQYCIIGRPGAELSVEQRKRVTIGVELVAKPSLLIFLGEPTSGLDGQSAFSTLRFLKKLAAAGQAILCTIHQPSAQIFAQFDTLLLLASGGKTVYFGDVGDNAATVMDYFARNGMPCPKDANPTEHMIDVVSASLSKGRDWNKVWLASPEYVQVSAELVRMVEEAAAKPVTQAACSNEKEFATDLWTQIKVVTYRMNVTLWRNNDYTNNKISLHFFSSFFNAFSFYRIGNSVADLQLTLFAVFNFVFVAPGVIAQLQPLFIARRDIYDAREKKSRIYSWKAFVTGLIVSEFPYLIVCAVAYFLPFYWTIGLPNDSKRAGATFFVMLLYEFIYTGMGQAIAAFAPNAVFARFGQPLGHRLLVVHLRRARALPGNHSSLALLAVLSQPVYLRRIELCLKFKLLA
jgi:ATP-binding cassette subfamily G (WHITE) protein 2 (SNQ2)